MTRAHGRHRRPRRQVPLVLGGLLAMVAGCGLAFLLLGAPVPTGIALVVGAAGWLLVRRRRST